MNSRLILSFTCLIAVSSFFYTQLSFAEPNPKTFGRAKDGRAYRIDESGFQLTDQLAELEVTVDELQKQVQALEDETIEKQQRIDRLLASGAKERKAGIGETNLVKPEKRIIAEPSQMAVSHPAVADCSAVVAPLNIKIAELESAIHAQQSTKIECDYETAKRPLLDQIEKLQLALMKGPSKEDLVDSEKAKASLEQSLAQTKNELANRDERISSLSSELDRTKTTLETLSAQNAEKSRLAKEAEYQAKTESERQSIVESARARVGTNDSENSSSKKLSNSSDISTAKKGFQEQLTNIQKLIGQRKDLLDSLKQSKKGITIQIHPLVSASGKSLDSLRVEVSKFSSDADSNAISKGLTDVQTQLVDDIKVLKRLAG